MRKALRIWYTNIMTDLTNSPDEVLDLVNEQDEAIGTIIRAAAHSNPCFIHRQVSILIVDSTKSAVLLQQRTALKKEHPLVWSVTAAGHVPSGVTAERGAHLELEQEVGFDAPLIFVEKNTRV